jgi:outer membrane protein OmpA-like peptidoglycan-associated protein
MNDNNNPEDWGMTRPNLRLPNQPSQPGTPPPDDYGMTTPNLRLPNSPPAQSYTPPPDDYGKTVSNLRLPNNVNYDPTPRRPPEDVDFGIHDQVYYEAANPRAAEPVAQPVKQETKKGLPLWFWLTTIFALFFVVAGAMVGIYFLLTYNTGFILVIKGARPGSDVFVDGKSYGVTQPDGTIRVPTLASGNRTVKVIKQGFADFNQNVSGTNGETIEVIAQQKPLGNTAVNAPCADKDKRVCEAEQRANEALDGLKEPINADDLVKALNMFIINFDVNKYDIPPAREVFLRKAAEKMKLLPSSTIIEVGGHTDSDGTDEDNQILSNNRAKSVRTTLILFGVNEQMLTDKGYGEKQPVAPNDTDENKFKNRRIQYSVIKR